MKAKQKKVTFEEKVYNKCLKAKVISFDIFDTLVIRDIVDPKDIFLITDRLNVEINEGLSDRESTNQLLEAELSLDHPVGKTISLLRSIKNEKKDVILTSDMYFGNQTMKGILENVGLIEGKDYNKLFISCDYGCTKKNGGLFAIIKRTYNVGYSDIVHIGDALRSDYILPSLLGIKAIRIRPQLQNGLHYRRRKELSNLQRFINNHICGCDYEYSMGYKCFGPLLYGFSIWLRDNISDDKSKVFFLSREGDTFLKALETMGFRNERLKYMSISRRSIQGALLWTYDDVLEMIQSIALDKSIGFLRVLSILGIEDDVKKDKAYDELKNKIYEGIEEFVKDEKACLFISEYKQQIIASSKAQFEAMDNYFESIGFNTKDSCVIVDVGWKGTMQKCLNRYLKIKNNAKQIRGLYLGVRNSINKDNSMNGFLFNGDDIRKQIEVFSLVGFLESVLSEKNGSIQRYCRREEGDYYALGEYEYGDFDKEKIKKIQDGMLSFVRDMHNSVVKSIICFDSYISTYYLFKCCNSPKRAEIEFYRNLEFRDKNYDMNAIVGTGVKPLKKTKKELMNSIWKTAYLRCAYGRFFPARLVYGVGYCLRNIKNR